MEYTREVNATTAKYLLFKGKNENLSKCLIFLVRILLNPGYFPKTKYFQVYFSIGPFILANQHIYFTQLHITFNGQRQSKERRVLVKLLEKRSHSHWEII